jgi:regulator of replication initiation timing
MELPDITQQIVELATAYRLSVEENKDLRRQNIALREENNLLNKQLKEMQKRKRSPEPHEKSVKIARTLSFQDSQPLTETEQGNI